MHPVTITTKHNVDTESNTNSSKRRYLFTDEQRRILKQTFENEQYPSQAKLEELVDELSLPINKISNWFHNARMRAKPNIHSIDTNKISTSPLNDNENDQDDNDDPDDDNDDDDDDGTLPTIVPLNSSWLNGTIDSDSSTSPISLSTSSTNPISLLDEQKPTSFVSTFSSSSKKRKSIPQKIITTKKLHIDPTPENDNSEEINMSNQT
jgi:hypothetical protein